MSGRRGAGVGEEVGERSGGRRVHGRSIARSTRPPGARGGRHRAQWRHAHASRPDPDAARRHVAPAHPRRRRRLRPPRRRTPAWPTRGAEVMTDGGRPPRADRPELPDRDEHAGAGPAGRVAGGVRSWSTAAPGDRIAPGLPVGRHRIRPIAARGIGSAILAWAIARADEILAGQPADLVRLVEAFKDERLADAVALHEAAGFRPGALVLRHAPRPPRADPGRGHARAIRIEGYEADLGERVRRRHNEAFADHWGSEPLTPEIWDREFVGDPYFRARPLVRGLRRRRDRRLHRQLRRRGRLGGRPAFATAGSASSGVRRPWRRRGLATALLVRSMRAFRDAGMDAATLGVDAENPTGRPRRLRAGRVPAGPAQSVRLQRPFGG